MAVSAATETFNARATGAVGFSVLPGGAFVLCSVDLGPLFNLAAVRALAVFIPISGERALIRELHNGKVLILNDETIAVAYAAEEIGPLIEDASGAAEALRVCVRVKFEDGQEGEFEAGDIGVAPRDVEHGPHS